MNKIRTWEELVSSDLPLKGCNIMSGMMGTHFATIERHEDGRLHLDYGLVLLSIIHEVDGERMLVVHEAPIGRTLEFSLFTPSPFLDISRAAGPHYRTADNLGLVGNHHDVTVRSVLVPMENLDEIEFSIQPAPLRQFELDLLMRL